VSYFYLSKNQMRKTT